MSKFVATLAVLLALCAPIRAQEQVQANMIFSLPCNGAANVAGGNQEIFLENYVNALLPSTIYITRTVIWNEMGPFGELPAGATGNVSFAVDPGRGYAASADFPATQNTQVQFVKTLAIWELFPGGSNQSWRDFSPPVSYHPGQDAILVAPECKLPNNANLYLFFGVYFAASGDLSTLPMPIGTYAVPNDSVTIANAPIYIRDLLPAQTGTKLRVHVSMPTLVASSAAHVSVGVQNGNGPNTLAAPVELTFNGSSGYSLLPGAQLWSDWIDFPVTAGQNLLINVSFPLATNYWSYKAVSAYGNWSSAVDGWSSAAMPGSVTFQANRTHAVDGVQQQ